MRSTSGWPTRTIGAPRSVWNAPSIAANAAPWCPATSDDERSALRQALLAEDEQADERRLQEEREDALERERLADDPSRGVREARPSLADQELERDPRRDTEDEVDGEDAAQNRAAWSQP